VLAHGFVRGRLDHDFGTRGDELLHADHERHLEFARERAAAGGLAPAGYRDNGRLRQPAGADLLEKQPRDDPAAEYPDAHVSSSALFSSAAARAPSARRR
jgi:hypothetical protein